MNLSLNFHKKRGCMMMLPVAMNGWGRGDLRAEVLCLLHLSGRAVLHKCEWQGGVFKINPLPWWCFVIGF